MPGTGTPNSISLEPAASAWRNFGWKTLSALLILLLLTAGIPISADFLWTLVGSTFLVWGGLVVAIAAHNLLSAPGNLRWVWTALAVGAYAALIVPGTLKHDASRLADALGPVAALTLIAHLARRDLPQALRDWVIMIGLPLYAALGVISMALVIYSFGGGGTNLNGLTVFIAAVLLPPLILEGVLILLRKAARLNESLWTQIGAVILATALPIAMLSFTQLNSATPLFASLAFDLFVGLLLCGALLISLLTRPMIEAAAGAHPDSPNTKLGRALVELSHGPILISLTLYIPLRLLTGT